MGRWVNHIASPQDLAASLLPTPYSLLPTPYSLLPVLYNNQLEV
ncbi:MULTISPECIES: hypothetical protein [Moorena]|nr:MULTISPECIES: hypothetical protein [Moorena]